MIREINLHLGCQRGFDGLLAIEMVDSQQFACAGEAKKGKGIKASLEGHHLALVPRGHGLSCMFSVPGCLQYPSSLCQRPGICPAWDEDL